MSDSDPNSELSEDEVPSGKGLPTGSNKQPGKSAKGTSNKGKGPKGNAQNLSALLNMRKEQASRMAQSRDEDDDDEEDDEDRDDFDDEEEEEKRPSSFGTFDNRSSQTKIESDEDEDDEEEDVAPPPRKDPLHVSKPVADANVQAIAKPAPSVLPAQPLISTLPSSSAVSSTSSIQSFSAVGSGASLPMYLMQSCVLIHQKRNSMLMKEQGSSHLLAKMQDKTLRHKMMRGAEIPFMNVDFPFDIVSAPSQPPRETTPAETGSSASSMPRVIQKPIKPKAAATKKKEDAYEITDGDPTRAIEDEERTEYRKQMEANVMMYSDASTDHRVRDEQFFLNMDIVMRKVKQIAVANGLSNGFSEGVCETISLAVQERIRTLLDRLISISKYRLDLTSETMDSTITTNPGQVIRSIVTEESKANEQKRSQDQMEVDEESNIGQSGRGKTELPLQEQEKRMLESSNVTALAATGLGSIRKRARTSGSSSAIRPVSSTAASTAAATRLHQKQNRKISLLDILYFLENDRRLSRSLLMYFSYYCLKP